MPPETDFGVLSLAYRARFTAYAQIRRQTDIGMRPLVTSERQPAVGRSARACRSWFNGGIALVYGFLPIMLRLKTLWGGFRRPWGDP